jgi:predicted amidohydrolase
VGQELSPRERHPRGTSTTPLPCIHPKVREAHHLVAWLMPLTTTIGELVALYRKIHLFDIDIPGKITFKVSGHYICEPSPSSDLKPPDGRKAKP